MKRSSLPYFLSAFTILMVIVACGFPSRATQPPTIDLAAMETVAVGTAQSAMAQTALANPATVTPLPMGMEKEEQSDGSTLFSDYEGGYQIAFPKGWIVVIPDKGNIAEDLSSIPEQEENISKLIQAAKSADTNHMIRAFGFNLKAPQGSYIPNINVSHNTNSLLTATPLKDLVDAMVQYYPSMNVEVLSSEVKKTPSGMEIGVIDTQGPMNTPSGDKIDLQQKQVMVKSANGIVTLTFSTVKDATVDLTADVDKVIKSFQLLK